jgi:hypothetical protein
VTIVECPHCGERHEIHPSWRAATELDAGREPELVVAAEAKRGLSRQPRSRVPSPERKAGRRGAQTLNDDP